MPIAFIDAFGLLQGKTTCDGNGNWGAWEKPGESPEDQECVKEHEKQHVDDMNKKFPNACKGVPKGQDPPYSDGLAKAMCQSECDAWKKTKACIENQCKKGSRPPQSPSDKAGLDLSVSTYCDLDYCAKNVKNNWGKGLPNDDWPKIW